MKNLIFGAALVAAALAGATIAEAHPRLTSVAPAMHARVSAPTEVRVAFNEPLVPRFSTIAVSDRGGHAIAIGQVAFSRDHRQIAAALPRLAPGTYRVNWRVVSTDTHRVSGVSMFSVS